MSDIIGTGNYHNDGSYLLPDESAHIKKDVTHCAKCGREVTQMASIGMADGSRLCIGCHMAKESER